MANATPAISLEALNVKRTQLSTLLLLLATPVAGMAQTVTGAVRGTITDASGAIVPGAKVMATNVATGVSTTATTDQAGLYSIRFLQIGQYTLSVEMAGFTTATYGPFSLEIDQTAKIDIPLAVGASTTKVTVSDEYQPILNTENATLGETFTENTINSIPLNGRDFSQLTVFTPGAVATSYGSFGGQASSERDTGGSTIPNVNGNRQQSNNYLLDGQEINENLNNTIGYTPSPDSLDQVRVVSSNANAEFGNVNGGDMLLVTKSGSNAFHGSAFMFLENYNLDANSWTNKDNLVPVPINPFTQTLFGGTIGGPIIKDKLFFFADYEGYRWHSGGLANYNVAPVAFRNGDFSQLLALTDANGKPAPIQLWNTSPTSGPVPYANNQVPITNPLAVFLFNNPKAYPLPNNPTSDPYGVYHNFVGPTNKFQRNDQGDLKIDYHFRDRDVISARYSQGYAQDGQVTDPLPVEFPSASNYPDHLFNVAWTHTVSSAIVNQARASYARVRYNSGVTTDPSGIFGLTGNSLVGIPSKAQLTAGFSEQSISGSGDGAVSSFGANPTPEVFIDNVFEYSDNLTWQRGKHLLKFGAEFTRYQQNSFYPGNDGELGQFSYNGSYTSNPDTIVAPGSLGQGYSFADFVTAQADDVQIGDVTGRTGQRQWRSAFFAQDDYKIMPNLTLNIGLRYEFDQPIFEVNNKEANLNLTTGAIEYAGQDGNSRSLYDPTYTNFMPRIGFAYQVKPRLVVRGGYGITTYLEGTGANLRLTQNPPFHEDFEQQGTSPIFDTTTNTYTPGISFSTAAGFPTTVVPATTFYAWKKNLQSALIQEFSLTTEYQILPNSSLQVGYVGEVGHHLTDPQFGNQLSAPGATAPFAEDVGQGGVVKITATDSSMNYQALEAVYRQRLTAGLELTANYTYAKALTDDIGYYGVSSIDQQYYQQNAYDLKSEWGPSGEDVRQAFSATGTYALPFGRGKLFGSNVNYIVDEALGGWKLSGSGLHYTGFPVTVTSNANYSSLVKAYTGAARPNQLRPLHIQNRNIHQWFGDAPGIQGANACGPGQDNGICVFAQQPDNAFGSERPGSLRAPGFENVDLALEKSFPVWHENRVNFRADAFNALNITSYGNPDNGISDTGFGQITGTRSTERHIQLELKYAF
jgi:hypothetical protein